MFKVVMQYPDGTTEEDDERFETEAEAEAYGSDQCNNYIVGCEVMHMSNPGDYPFDEDLVSEVDFEVVEVDA